MKCHNLEKVPYFTVKFPEHRASPVIEHQQFGEDGFDEAVQQISEIEVELGLADLGAFTAPPAL